MSMQQGLLSELVSTDVNATRTIVPASKYSCRCNIIQELLSKLLSADVNATRITVPASK